MEMGRFGICLKAAGVRSYMKVLHFYLFLAGLQKPLEQWGYETSARKESALAFSGANISSELLSRFNHPNEMY